MKKKRFSLAVPAVLLTFIVIFIACGSKKNERYNLLVITLDTTRADSIGAYGNRQAATPNMDRLANNGIMFQNCFASTPLTLPSHCTIFTGRYPIAHKVRNNGTYFLPERETTLAEILKANGFLTFACVASYTLLSKFGLNQGFDLYDENFQLKQTHIPYSAEIPADLIAQKFAAWIEKNHDRKFFTWLHFYDPHSPYQSHPEVDKKFIYSERSKYEGEIAYVDLQIGKIIQLLEANKILRKTIIVIAGDHGEAFGEHKEFGHGIFCYDETLKVPLIFYNPALFKSKMKISDRVNLVDVLPSILQCLKIASPDAVQGKSFHGLLVGKKEKQQRISYFESVYGFELNHWAPVMGMIAADLKYISLLEPELYNLGRDPGEQANLYLSRNILARELDGKLKKFILDHSSAQEAGKRELNSEDLEKLKALGYIGSGSAKSSTLIDPKKGIDLFLRADALRDKIKAKKFLEAQHELDQIMSLNPGVQLPVFYEIGFLAKKNLGRVFEATATLQKAVSLFPLNEEFKVMLAIELISQGDHARAQELCRSLLEHDPRFATATILLGDICLKQNDLAGAVRYYRQAMQIEPQNIQLQVNLSRVLLKMGESQQASAIMAEISKNKSNLQNLDNIETLSETVNYFIGNNQLDLALESLRKILDQDPNNVDALVNSGTVHYKMGELETALQFYKSAVKLDPSRAQAFSNMGSVYFSSFQRSNERSFLQLALHHFDKAIQLDPNLSEGYNGRGAAYLVLDENEKAVGDFKKVIQLKPEFVDAYFNLTYALMKSGRKQEALDTASRLKKSFYDKLNPKDQKELDLLISEIRS
jgi:arylsulfatase A-like enzyme/Flp pilus assembly protein TadD